LTDRSAKLDEPKLKRKFRPIYRRKGIGVVSLVGGITQGESQQSPIPLPIFGTATAGEKTIVRSLRAAEKLNNLAALIFYVDTRGGDAFASDLIQREVERIGQKIPVIVYMGDVAASGGYYVSAKAHHIICQPATVTGSIGVVSGKPSLMGLYEKAHINAVSIKRGKNAGLYAGSAPLTEEERQILFNSIFESYKEFKWVVADGRDLPFDELDKICLGKVWTGRQALGHKLVDQNGSFLDAIKKAREMGELPDSEDILVPVYEIAGSRRGRLWPEPFKNEKPPASIAEWVQRLYRNGQGIQYVMPFEIIDHL
ncbi:MAG: signal peptide peptidase SppA, partial [Chloroflexota bacterium]